MQASRQQLHVWFTDIPARNPSDRRTDPSRQPNTDGHSNRDRNAPIPPLRAPRSVWVDRLRRRPILIVADIGRFVLPQLLFGLARPVFSINHVSLRQSITPERLLGRMNASIYFLVYGITPIGSLLGGILGQGIGLQETLVIAAVALCLHFWKGSSRKGHHVVSKR